MSTAMLRRHAFGLMLSARVIVVLQNNGYTKERLSTATVRELRQIGLDEREATEAVAIARKAAGR